MSSSLEAAKHALLSGIARVELLHCQLPIIQQAPRLTGRLGSADRTKIWICREDCTSGLAFGGNKVRKLEFVVVNAIKEGAQTLVTTGGVQSNHMRQTAAVAGKLGMKAVLIPKDMVSVSEDGHDVYFSAGNVQLNSLLGADVLDIGTEPAVAMRALVDEGRKPYWIPAGASQHEAGAYGYARWALQLAEWEEANGVYFDTIVTACGGGSTLAGMVVGNRIAGCRRRMVGVSIFADSSQSMWKKVYGIAQKAAIRLELEDIACSTADFEINDRFHTGAYGKYDEATTEAIRMTAETEGVLLDPVYTGKTMAAVISGIRNGDFAESKNLLFVHTGGQTVLSAYPELR